MSEFLAHWFDRWVRDNSSLLLLNFIFLILQVFYHLVKGV